VKPTPIALSLGDPAGIGPEIIVKAWRALRNDGPPFMVVGDLEVLNAASVAGASSLQRVTGAEEAARVFSDTLPVLDLPLQGTVVAGRADPAHAHAVIRWIETAAGLALSGEVEAVVTSPIAKAPLHRAGFAYPGHTEFLADLVAAA
jgi:4-hydroxythreonine-4-phosphate dehydrogenase